MNSEQKKMLFYWYIENTPLEEIKPLEELDIEYILRKKIGIE